METLNLPEYDFRFRTIGQSKEIFDCVRRKFIPLTPEEWVRQHFIRYLSEGLGYPLSLMAIEKGLAVNRLQKRADIVVHDRSGAPWMIVECKAPLVQVSREALYQASGYHETLASKYVVATNGMTHYCCEFSEGQFKFLENMPSYPEAR
jgi:Type I restriction enzyme R protein N terminus (HSDR_N)